MTFTTNNHPKPVDLRGLPATMANSMYQPVGNGKTAAPLANPSNKTKKQVDDDAMRGYVVSYLKLAHIDTDGMDDAQMLAAYTKQLKANAAAAVVNAEQCARQLQQDEFKGYSINSLMAGDGSA